jgi:hypothetical protein
MPFKEGLTLLQYRRNTIELKWWSNATDAEINIVFPVHVMKINVTFVY